LTFCSSLRKFRPTIFYRHWSYCTIYLIRISILNLSEKAANAIREMKFRASQVKQSRVKPMRKSFHLTHCLFASVRQNAAFEESESLFIFQVCFSFAFNYIHSWNMSRRDRRNVDAEKASVTPSFVIFHVAKSSTRNARRSENFSPSCPSQKRHFNDN